MILFRPQYKDRASGEMVSSRFYYLRWRGKRWPLKVEDRRLAEQKAAKLIKTLELGGDPQQQERSRFEAFTCIVQQYVDSRQCGAKQQYQLRLRLEKVADGIGAKTLADFAPEKVEEWLRKSEGSLRTKAHYRSSLVTFGKWLCAKSHAPRNPFEALPTVKNVESDRRLVRRALTPEQLDKLIATAEQSRRSLCKLNGKQRAMLYRLIINTGLRRLEAASLKPASFTLKDEGTSTVEVDSAYTKNRLRAVLPLPRSLAPLLREYLRGLPEDEAVWPLTARSMTQHMVQKDMAEAGLDVKVGHTTYDFHSLRGQYATRLAQAGVSLVKAAKLLRHSDPRLTMAVYTHLSTEDLAEEANKLG